MNFIQAVSLFQWADITFAFPVPRTGSPLDWRQGLAWSSLDRYHLTKSFACWCVSDIALLAQTHLMIRDSKLQCPNTNVIVATKRTLPSSNVRDAPMPGTAAKNVNDVTGSAISSTVSLPDPSRLLIILHSPWNRISCQNTLRRWRTMDSQVS